MARHPASQSRGFTIIELMVGISVLAVLLAIGVPAFTDTIRNNRTATQTNELITALNLARSEAMKLGMPVSVCAAATIGQTGCAAAGAGNWQFGAIVFSDRANPGVLDAGELVQIFPVARGGISVLSNNAAYVRFGASGTKLFPAVGTDVVFGVRHSSCTGNNLREVTVISTGRANLTKKACS